MTAQPISVPEPGPSMAYAIVEPDGAIKQVYGPLGTQEALQILHGGFSAHPGPPDWGPIAILRLEPQAGPPNKVMAKMRPDGTFLGTVIVAGVDAEGNLTSLDVRDEESLRNLTGR